VALFGSRSKRLAVALLSSGALVWGGHFVERPSGSTETPFGTVRRSDLTVALSESGTLMPASSLTYHSPLVGRETEILSLAPEGTFVQAGDVLVKLDVRELENEQRRAQAALRQARTELARAKAEQEQADGDLQDLADGAGSLVLDEARSAYELASRKSALSRGSVESLKPLLDKGFINREEFDAASLDAEQSESTVVLAKRKLDILANHTYPRDRRRAQAQLKQRADQVLAAEGSLADAQAQLAALHEAIEACAIYAKQPGLVVYEDNLVASPRRRIRVGDRVTASQGLVSIPDVTQMEVYTSVREADLALVRVGQPARVAVQAFGSLTLNGHIERIGVLAHSDPATPGQKRFDLVLTVDSRDPRLRPEMTARVDIDVEHRTSVLLVPVNALFNESNGSAVVYLSRGGRRSARTVQVGISDGLFTEIRSGLTDGDIVQIGTDAPGSARSVIQ
jgi:multidrug efflux pump subunit AcrA (membrane-fusion protein)